MVARSFSNWIAFHPVRLATVIRPKPESAKATTTARAAPPAPKTTAEPPTGISIPSSVMARRNPCASVLSPDTLPSQNIRVLAAPIRVASCDTSSRIGITVCLCGIVTLIPSNWPFLIFWTMSGNSWFSILTFSYSAWMCNDLKNQLWRKGLRLCSTGLPITAKCFISVFYVI